MSSDIDCCVRCKSKNHDVWPVSCDAADEGHVPVCYGCLTAEEIVDARAVTLLEIGTSVHHALLREPCADDDAEVVHFADQLERLLDEMRQSERLDIAE
jgi:hypothetical protein